MNDRFFGLQNLSYLICLLVVTFFIPDNAFGNYYDFFSLGHSFGHFDLMEIPFFSIFIIILSLIVFFKVKNDDVMRAIAVSVCSSKILSIIFPYRIIPFIAAIVPLLYSFYIANKKGNKILKIDLIVVFFAVCMMHIGLISNFLDIHSYNLDFVYEGFSFYLLLVTLFLFYIFASRETSDKRIKSAAYIGALGASIVLVYAIIGIVFNYCDHPECDTYFIMEEVSMCSVYMCCLKAFKAGFILIALSGISMAYYFYIIFRRLNHKNSLIFIPAIIALVSFGIMYGSATSFAHYEGFGAFEDAHEVRYIYVIVYATISYSYYKFSKLF